MIRKGQRSGSTLWYCHACKACFSGHNKVKTEDVWAYYRQGNYTVAQIAEHFNVSPSTIKRRLQDFLPDPIVLRPKSVVILMDITYWGRDFGVVLFMETSTHQILHYQFITRKEHIADYYAGISYLEEQGYTIKGIVSDGLQGICKVFSNIPFQYCQFHQLQRIRQLLTSNPRLEASIELKALAKQLTGSTRLDFSQKLEAWHNKWRDFLNETTLSKEGLLIYTHHRLRSAYYSLKRHLKVLFTYQDHPELGMPNTNNCWYYNRT